MAPALRIVRSLAAVDDNPDESWLFCPWLPALPPGPEFWLAALAWHDSNGSLLDNLPAQPPRRKVYAGVFCVDPFRRREDILHALRRAGISGIVNLPSVSFIDGEVGTLLAGFSLGVEREIAFLRGASGAGFHVAGCAATLDAAQAMAGAGAELIIAHGGPPLPGSADPGHAVAARLRRHLPDAVPVLPLGRLLAQS
ncbi:MAG: hypothetical protein JWP20_1622 [Roseomonas sp.]|jgi:predicted TIM-barrel enzyme|nr:hypothetical protein [Roseomonas sp.]